MRRARYVRWLTTTGVVLGAVGWWLPWVLHPNGAAALALLGLDLGEFFKFTSLWREGGLVWERHAFFLPPAVASVLLSLLAADQALRRRAVATTIAGLLALVLLPEFERWAEFRTDEFWFQTSLVLIGVLFAAGVLLAGPRLPARPRRLLGFLVASIGALLPLWAFWRVELLLEWLYGTQIVWGPGLWLTAGGFLLAAAGWARLALERR